MLVCKDIEGRKEKKEVKKKKLLVAGISGWVPGWNQDELGQRFIFPLALYTPVHLIL